MGEEMRETIVVSIGEPDRIDYALHGQMHERAQQDRGGADLEIKGLRARRRR